MTTEELTEIVTANSLAIAQNTAAIAENTKSIAQLTNGIMTLHESVKSLATATQAQGILIEELSADIRILQKEWQAYLRRQPSN